MQLSLVINPKEPFSDILTFQLGEAGFEMFEETESGLLAFIRSSQYSRAQIVELVNEITAMGASVIFTEEIIPWKNWNEEWEKNFQPEIISNRIYVRADFHPPSPEFPIEIIVQPRMAFGTGHHATTSQMMEQMLLLDLTAKSVLDMGCGTGILAILACKCGATEVTAIDNDPNAVSITIENAMTNHCPDIISLEGESSEIPGTYDVILANINRNIILKDVPQYTSAMRNDSYLLTSGYYLTDLEDIRQAAELNGLEYLHHSEKSNWCCALFYKP